MCVKVYLPITQYGQGLAKANLPMGDCPLPTVTLVYLLHVPSFVWLTHALRATPGLFCSPPCRSPAQAAGAPRKAGGPSLAQKM